MRHAHSQVSPQPRQPTSQSWTPKPPCDTIITMSLDSYIYKKEVDWSVLQEGFAVPVGRQGLFYENINLNLGHGERKDITLLIEGREFDAKLINQDFDRTNYPDHPEMLQVRYKKNGELSKDLQAVFYSSYSAIAAIKSSGRLRPKQPVRLPELEREYMAIYSTAREDTFEVDCITRTEINDTRKIIRGIPEMEIEQILQSDETATLIKKMQTMKIRKLDRTIGDCLKRLYENRCQICGQFIGERYDATVIHTHHIDYFSHSLNNDADNILVVCPNHHGIIHAVNPIFNRTRLAFIYHNGVVEGLKLNKHLLGSTE